MNYACKQMLSSSADKLAGEKVATLQRKMLLQLFYYVLGWKLSILIILRCVHFQFWFQSTRVSGPFHIIIHCAGIQVIIMKMVKYFKSKLIRENETVQQMVGW